MAHTPRKHRGKLNSKAAINKAIVDLQPFSNFGGLNDIIPFGLDNLYPDRILEAIRQSPTAKGCVKSLREFVFGQGVALGGDTVVNRTGETLNDVISQSVRDYIRLDGFSLHFNFNLLGQIVEIFNLQIEYVRKWRTLDKVDIGVWNRSNRNFVAEYITIDIYGLHNPIDKMRSEGFDRYKGQVLYFSKDAEIYPTSVLDGSTLSAEYEREAQIYPYANIKNGFSTNAIIKLPSLSVGAGNDGAKNLTDELNKLHGAENAGGSIVVPVTIGESGDPKDYKMVEFLTPTNVDALFVNQNNKAKNNLLTTYTMIEELLGPSKDGAFSDASFDQAFNVKNGTTEGDRKIIERQFNKILPASVFPVDKIEIVPLKMKTTAQ